jgi:hypothetical protein
MAKRVSLKPIAPLAPNILASLAAAATANSESTTKPENTANITSNYSNTHSASIMSHSILIHLSNDSEPASLFSTSNCTQTPTRLEADTAVSVTEEKKIGVSYTNQCEQRLLANAARSLHFENESTAAADATQTSTMTKSTLTDDLATVLTSSSATTAPPAETNNNASTASANTTALSRKSTTTSKTASSNSSNNRASKSIVRINFDKSLTLLSSSDSSLLNGAGSHRYSFMDVAAASTATAHLGVDSGLGPAVYQQAANCSTVSSSGVVVITNDDDITTAEEDVDVVEQQNRLRAPLASGGDDSAASSDGYSSANDDLVNAAALTAAVQENSIVVDADATNSSGVTVVNTTTPAMNNVTTKTTVPSILMTDSTNNNSQLLSSSSNISGLRKSSTIYVSYTSSGSMRSSVGNEDQSMMNNSSDQHMHSTDSSSSPASPLNTSGKEAMLANQSVPSVVEDNKMLSTTSSVSNSPMSASSSVHSSGGGPRIVNVKRSLSLKCGLAIVDQSQQPRPLVNINTQKQQEYAQAIQLGLSRHSPEHAGSSSPASSSSKQSLINRFISKVYSANVSTIGSSSYINTVSSRDELYTPPPPPTPSSANENTFLPDKPRFFPVSAASPVQKSFVEPNTLLMRTTGGGNKLSSSSVMLNRVSIDPNLISLFNNNNNSSFQLNSTMNNSKMDNNNNTTVMAGGDARGGGGSSCSLLAGGGSVTLKSAASSKNVDLDLAEVTWSVPSIRRQFEEAAAVKPGSVVDSRKSRASQPPPSYILRLSTDKSEMSDVSSNGSSSQYRHFNDVNGNPTTSI